HRVPALRRQRFEPRGEVLLGAGESVHEKQRTLPHARLGDREADIPRVDLAFRHEHRYPRLLVRDPRAYRAPKRSFDQAVSRARSTSLNGIDSCRSASHRTVTARACATTCPDGPTIVSLVARLVVPTRSTSMRTVTRRSLRRTSARKSISRRATT